MASPIPGYAGYEGWDPTAAQADFKATGGVGKGGPSASGGGVPDPVDTAKRLNEFTVQANQPAIQSYQSQIPEIQKQFATTGLSIQSQRQPLEDRYNALVAGIKGDQTQSLNSQTLTTQNELGRRGIQGGGLADQTLTSALTPINSQYASLLGQTSASHEGDVNNINQLLAQLPNQETDAERQVQNAIAQLQAGNPASAIQGGLSYSAQVQQAQQAAAQLALAQQGQNQQYQLSSQNYGLEQQKLAQQLAQEQIQNRLSQQQLGISGGQLGVSQGNLALAQQQFNAQYGNGAGITQSDLDALRNYSNKVNGGAYGPGY